MACAGSRIFTRFWSFPTLFCEAPPAFRRSHLSSNLSNHCRTNSIFTADRLTCTKHFSGSPHSTTDSQESVSDDVSETTDSPKPEEPAILSHDSWAAEGAIWSERLHSAAPVVFLHGLLGFKEEFRRFGQELATATHRKVMAFDARNHGSSPHRNSMKYGEMADDVIKTLRKLNERRAIFVAHSMGAVTAISLAAKKPEMVSGCFLIDVGMTDAPRRPQANAFLQTLSKVQFDQSLSLRDNRERVTKILRSQDIEEFIIHERLLPNIIKDDGEIKWRCNMKAFRRNISSILKTSPEIGLNSEVYNGPTFVLAGESSDYVRPDDDHLIVKHFPNVEIRRVNNAGHFVHYDQPNIFYSSLVDFIEKYDGPLVETKSRNDFKIKKLR